jgi:hypothetical protein
MLVVSWLWFSLIVWTCQVVFGAAGPAQLQSKDVASVRRLFGIAAWGWTVLFAAMFLARLASFDLQVPETSGILDTLTSQLPRSLLDMHLHTQPDMGSIIGSAVIFASAVAPFAMLRVRLGTTHGEGASIHNSVLGLGVLGLAAMMFPRLGPVLLVAVVAIFGSKIRRSLPSIWPQRGSS